MQFTLAKITAVQACGPTNLRLRFSDGTEKEVDLGPIMHGELYGPLRSPSLFQEVKIDPESGVVFWPNGADFDPAILYRWEVYSEELAQRAVTWTAGAHIK
ncbi:MAG: DUF2442 domain-containing protein [Spirochaetales bacterium]|nr:DUF2442 domain-containing protein [Spirochaetales bacterium]